MSLLDVQHRSCVEADEASPWLSASEIIVPVSLPPEMHVVTRLPPPTPLLNQCAPGNGSGLSSLYLLPTLMF